MGIYLVHELAGTRKDLEPYISNETILMILRDKGIVSDQQAIVDECIEEGEAGGHSYARPLYTVPFDPVDPKFRAACGVLTADALYHRGVGSPDESFEKRYDHTIEWLNDLANGTVTLTTPQTPTPSDGGLTISSVNERYLSFDNIGDF